MERLRDLLRSFLLLLAGASVLLHALSWWQIGSGQPLEPQVLLGLLASPFVCLSGQAAYGAEPVRPLLSRLCTAALGIAFASLLALLLTGRLAPLWSGG